jgi:hypothetical protein
MQHTTVRIYRLEVDHDSNMSDLVAVDTIEAPANPLVALQQWFFEADDEVPNALYEAQLPNGSRSGLIRREKS